MLLSQETVLAELIITAANTNFEEAVAATLREVLLAICFLRKTIHNESTNPL